MAQQTPAQQQAGVAAAVRGRVEIAMTAGAVGREVKSGEPIFLGNAIKSAADSGMQIMLLDQTTFTIGPNSEITIDQFVFDPSNNSGKVAASVAKGVFRFVTGKVAQQSPSDMTIRLPTGNIGIRGTIAVGSIEPGTNGQPPKQEVVLLGPGTNREGSARVGAIVLTGGNGGSGVTINQPGFGSQLGQGNSWGTPVRYTPEMINALQAKLDTPITGKGPGAPEGTGAPAESQPIDTASSSLATLTTILGASDKGDQAVADSAQSQMQSLATSGLGTTTTFDQLRMAGGNFFWQSTNTPLSGGGDYNFTLNVNPANREVGGGFSRVDVNGLNVSGTLFLGIQSFASSTGNAAFAYTGLSGLTGVLCSPSCTSNVNVTSVQNANGVIDATAAHSVFVSGMGPTTQGSGTATRQEGTAPLPP